MLLFNCVLTRRKGSTIIKQLLKQVSFLILVFLAVTFISSNTSAAYIKPTTDPSTVGFGARPTGLGLAYVGLADDVNAVFLNPAGLASLKNWQVMSMTTKLLNMIDYLTLAGTYTTDYGTIGLGYVGASISGSFVTDWALVEGDRGIVFPVTTVEAIDYSSTVILLAYGCEPKKFVDWGIFDKLSAGATFKIFSQGLTGGGISDGVLSGYDMDIGLMYKAQPWLTLGLTMLDCLPEDMGGKLTDASGEREHSLPSITKIGSAFKILGDESALYRFPQPLVYLLDLDYMSGATEYPALIHTGLEWWPSDYLALRVGIDQDIVGSETSSSYDVESNPTAGVGVYYAGFKFDYAYHKFGMITDHETSYITLSYAAPVEVPPVEQPKEYLKIVAPKDKLITYDEGVVIKGQVLDTGAVSSLTVNGTEISFEAGSGFFEASYPLLLGKNKFTVKAFLKDELVATSEVRILRLSSFKDVVEGYWAKEPVEMLATLGIIGGYPDATFRPDKVISRAELTTLLIKSKAISSTETVDTIFSDVTSKHWASFYIKNGVDLQLVNGYPDKTFKPAKSLTRAEGVTIFSRFAELKEPETILEGPFTDVPGRHWAAKSITAARSAGMLMYLLDKPFEPDKAMSRGEAAEILSKTPFAVIKINNLKNFDTY